MTSLQYKNNLKYFKELKKTIQYVIYIFTQEKLNNY